MSPHVIDTLNALLRPRARAATLAIAVLAASCGGVGEEGTGIRTESANVGVVSGVSDTTVTVNGVDYRREAAAVTDGVGKPVQGDLRIGMWVEVNGTAALDGSDATADTIRVRPAARGEIKTVAPDGTITLLDSPVTLGAGTVVDTGGDASSLVAGNLIEVHGPLAAASGAVVASRVERLATTPTVAVRYELRGRVSQLQTDLKTLTVGDRQVSYGSAAKVLVGAGLRNGLVVRVSSTVAPVDGVPWPVQDLRNDAELPANLGFLYTEGFVEQLQPGPLFQLEDLQVDASTANGQARVTANGQQVAVFGPRINGILKAKAVSVIQPGAPVVFTLYGQVSAYTSIASFRVRGVPIDATDLAAANPAALPPLADGARVRVDGTVRGRGLSATKIALLP